MRAVAAETAAAARAAGDRADACRRRRAELAAGRPVGAEDVRRAESALATATRRTAAAQRRFARSHPEFASSEAGAERPARRQPIDVPGLRDRARDLATTDLFTAYFGLGGHCGELELDAFLYAGLDLPVDELPVLAHAVWELTEL